MEECRGLGGDKGKGKVEGTRGEGKGMREKGKDNGEGGGEGRASEGKR